MRKKTGHCLCGSVSYEINSPPVFSITCHCTDCQKATGSAFSINIGVPDDAFSVFGNTLTKYADTGDSGKELRHYFCNQCGSPVFNEADAMPGLKVVKAGTLDDPTSFKPDTNIFCSSRMEWVTKAGETADFDKMPT
ncbi:MAG: hypothetical protein A6F71_09285 [Cycloclasticus sp. symbiont of Poecilosclerida sp. M]|nr:MAG: hypothetical protein A6F71_09285 [Cycloclasticus sp. symbiont of Poecilosclerida sp. M]